MVYLVIANAALIVMVIYLYYSYRQTKKNLLRQIKLLRNKNLKQEHDAKNFEKKFFHNNNDFHLKIEALMLDMLKLKQEKEKEVELRHNFEQKFKILQQKNHDFETFHQEFNDTISVLLKDISKYK